MLQASSFPNFAKNLHKCSVSKIFHCPISNSLIFSAYCSDLCFASNSTFYKFSDNPFPCYRILADNNLEKIHPKAFWANTHLKKL